jgi:hypothetical protein
MDLENLVGDAEKAVSEAGGAGAIEKDAEKVVSEVGGTAGIERDASGLEGVVTGDGSLVDKAKQAAAIIEAQESKG